MASTLVSYTDRAVLLVFATYVTTSPQTNPTYLAMLPQMGELLANTVVSRF